MKIAIKIFQYLILIALFAGLYYFFGDNWRYAISKINRSVRSCNQPLNIQIDPNTYQFKISQADFIKAVNEAIAIWEQPVNKKLFQITDNQGLKIHLVYDHRQQATDKLRSLGLNIDDSQSSYDALKKTYETYNQRHQFQRQELDNLTTFYNQQKTNYDNRVATINARGGATPEEARSLESDRLFLNNLSTTFQQKQAVYNQTVADINSISTVANKLMRDLNLSVEKYNIIGASLDTDDNGEYQEGLYISEPAGDQIIIYQFDDYQALVEVLAHELGHALGIDHLDNPESIMYYLNESGNASITPDDITALKKICKF